MKSLVAFIGFKGSGKNTAADALLNHKFISFSFADAIKDSLASIFCWDRQMLEGITAESREWREQVDPWWAARLDMSYFTPRWALTNFGTQIMRQHFNENVWVFNVERRISMVDDDTSVALIDCRFGNEIDIARQHGGKVIRIKRGYDPYWMEIAKRANNGNDFDREVMLKEIKVHESEWGWIGYDLDVTIENDSSIDDLHSKVFTELNL